MREWIAKNVLGLTRAPEVKIIDIKASLCEGKSVLVDTSANMPIREWIAPITTWPEYIKQPTVEIRTFTNPWPHFKGHDTSKFLEAGLWAIEDEGVMLISDTRTDLGDNPAASIDLVVELTRHAIASDKKLVVYIDRNFIPEEHLQSYYNRVLASVMDAATAKASYGLRRPLFAIDLLEEHETLGSFLKLSALMDIGPTVVTRIMANNPRPSGLIADIHIVERGVFRKHLRSNAEVILSDNSRASIKDHPDQFTFRKWDYKGYNFASTPVLGIADSNFREPDFA